MAHNRFQRILLLILLHHSQFRISVHNNLSVVNCPLCCTDFPCLLVRRGLFTSWNQREVRLFQTVYALEMQQVTRASCKWIQSSCTSLNSRNSVNYLNVNLTENKRKVIIILLFLYNLPLDRSRYTSLKIFAKLKYVQVIILNNYNYLQIIIKIIRKS